MTFNVRQPDQDDGANAWEHRRDLLVETILDARPDVIGTQELFVLQADYIVERATEYRWFGTGRFGDDRDKHVGIFYRPGALQLLDHGDFWLSETPEVPGSASWNVLKPRQVTWGLFEAAAGLRFQMFNTHFPYRQVEQHARNMTAELILSRIAALDPRLPVVVTADFNSQAGGEIHARLTETLTDAWISAAERHGPEGTLNGFGLNGFGKIREERRIDWILFRAPWAVTSAATLLARRDALYASDHYPVIAAFDAFSTSRMLLNPA